MDKILIATDFSPAANNAVAYGAALARYFNAEIILLNAFSAPLGGYYSVAPLDAISEMQNSGYEALREVRNHVIRLTGFDPGVECICEPGSPFGVISEYTHKHRVDLVVMGIVGQAGPLKKQFIGSSAISAARNLAVPLVIVPEKAVYSKIQKLSFACDLDHTEDSTLMQSARYLAKVFNAGLEIVQVLSKEKKLVDSERTSDFVEKTLQTVDHTVVSLRSEEPAKALSEYFKDHKTDMVIVNPKKHNLFQSLFIPGVTKHLAFQLEVPLLAIH